MLFVNVEGSGISRSEDLQMSTLQEFSDALADAVELAGQQVVRVDSRRRFPASGIVWSGDIVVTAHHVVERSENIRLGLHDGRTVEAELIGRDPATDLAVLRAETGLSGFNKAERLPRIGHLVMAVGRPGTSAQATIGIISAIGMNEPAPEPGKVRAQHRRGGFSFAYSRGGGGVLLEGAIQSDVVMYPGFSGGPLIDASGKLLGMNTSAVASGTSLSIPLSTISRIAEQLSRHGKIRRGFMGVSLQPMRLTDALAASVGQPTGLLIVATEPSGPADNAGLFQGDIVVALDGQPTHTLDELLALLNGERVGTSVPVRIIRGGQTQEIMVVIAERL